MAIGDLVFTKRAFGYGSEELDARQVTELKGLPNDEKLMRLGYFMPVPEGAKLFKCGVCGAKFMDEQARTIHGNNKHSD